MKLCSAVSVHQVGADVFFRPHARKPYHVSHLSLYLKALNEIYRPPADKRITAARSELICFSKCYHKLLVFYTVQVHGQRGEHTIAHYTKNFSRRHLLSFCDAYLFNDASNNVVIAGHPFPLHCFIFACTIACIRNVWFIDSSILRRTIRTKVMRIVVSFQVILLGNTGIC